MNTIHGMQTAQCCASATAVYLHTGQGGLKCCKSFRATCWVAGLGGGGAKRVGVRLGINFHVVLNVFGGNLSDFVCLHSTRGCYYNHYIQNVSKHNKAVSQSGLHLIYALIVLSCAQWACLHETQPSKWSLLWPDFISLCINQQHCTPSALLHSVSAAFLLQVICLFPPPKSYQTSKRILLWS